MLHCNMSSARGGGGGILPMRVGQGAGPAARIEDRRSP